MADTESSGREKKLRPIEWHHEPEEVKYFSTEIGDHLSRSEVLFLMKLSGREIEKTLINKIKNGRDFFSALMRSSTCEQGELSYMFEALQKIRRFDLLRKIYVSEGIDDSEDMLDDHFNKLKCIIPTKYKSQEKEPPPSFAYASYLRRKKGEDPGLCVKFIKRIFCCVRLRLSAEFYDGNTVLQGIVLPTAQSDPPDMKAECFEMAYHVLGARNILGTVNCILNFSHVTYLDAFWRDYLNGSLFESLKSAFITDSMKQTMEQHNIIMLLYVNEDDYFYGRITLLEKLERLMYIP